MAQWYHLGCLECLLFVDLHKFLPGATWYERFDAERYDFDLFPGHPTYCAVKANSAEILADLAADDARSQPRYVRELAAGLSQFLATHRDHQLFLISDMGDEPWDVGTDGWWKWKEQPIAFDYHTYLPRNLVEDLGIVDWPSAVRTLDHHPSGYNPPLEASCGDALESKWGLNGHWQCGTPTQMLRRVREAIDVWIAERDDAREWPLAAESNG